ncbi:MAG: hypothetical protein IJR99_09445 [Kiritimatiellae bacterium]|nr:hypothetical protein [Kiritimatiellia bacterium]
MRVRLLVGMLLAALAARGEVDWARLNIAAREHAKTLIRAGVPGVRPFWNVHAKAFIHSPAFEFQEVEGANEYRFTIEKAEPGRAACPQAAERRVKDNAPYHSWTAAKPWLPIPADIWDSLSPGYYTLKVENLGDATLLSLPATERSGMSAASPKKSCERTFYRAAVFHGPYPKGVCGYREAARKVYASVYNMQQVQGWKTSDDPPKGYDLYCYPAKILSSMIRALVRHSTGGAQLVATATMTDAINCVPPEASDAIFLARKMADWLIAHSQPADAPLAYFPPTYWGDRRSTAVAYAGQNMLLYPAHAALAYLELAEALTRAGNGADSKQYRTAALAIAHTYAKLQGADGTWPLKVREKDGSPVRANRLVPGRYILGLFDRVEQAHAGGSQLVATAADAINCVPPEKTTAGAINCAPPEVFAQTRDRAFAYVLDGPVKTWNWDGQFEDMDPMPPYKNLQKGVAADTAIRLFALGRIAEGCELVDWCEDQFVVWSDPIHNMDWRNWKTPTALEQYDYYTPIDASMGDMIGAFAAAYKATGNALYLEKAKALADNVTRNQRPDGTIPTYFDSRKGSDWVNCMVYVANRLEFLADAMSK